MTQLSLYVLCLLVFQTYSNVINRDTALKDHFTTIVVSPSVLQFATQTYVESNWISDWGHRTTTRPSSTIWYLNNTLVEHDSASMQRLSSKTTLTQDIMRSNASSRSRGLSTGNMEINYVNVTRSGSDTDQILHQSTLIRKTISHLSTIIARNSSPVVELASESYQLGNSGTAKSILFQTAPSLIAAQSNTAILSVASHSITDYSPPMSLLDPGTTKLDHPRTVLTASNSHETDSNFLTMTQRNRGSSSQQRSRITEAIENSIQTFSQVLKSSGEITARKTTSPAHRGSSLTDQVTSYRVNSVHPSSDMSKFNVESTSPQGTPSFSTTNTKPSWQITTSHIIATTRMYFQSRTIISSLADNSVMAPDKTSRQTKTTNTREPSETKWDTTKIKRTTSIHHTTLTGYSIIEENTPTIEITDIDQATNVSTGAPNFPFYYVLAICLPLAFLLGFTFAFIYFRRTRQDNSPQYSVTVEISSQKPDYEMKRMYSVIDINSGDVNKDFWTGLKADNARGSVVDLTHNVTDKPQ